jgi:hypothetical protein
MIFDRTGLLAFVELTTFHFRFSCVSILLEAVDRTYYRLSVRIGVTVFACLIECALLELVDILEVLPDHLEQFGIGIEQVILFKAWRILRSSKTV